MLTAQVSEGFHSCRIGCSLSRFTPFCVFASTPQPQSHFINTFPLFTILPPIKKKLPFYIVSLFLIVLSMLASESASLGALSQRFSFPFMFKKTNKQNNTTTYNQKRQQRRVKESKILGSKKCYTTTTPTDNRSHARSSLIAFVSFSASFAEEC